MRLAATCFALLCAPLAGAAERMEQFGYVMPITLTPGDALYALRLTAPVYRHAARADLADLRVFNASGEAVAHAIRMPKGPDKVPAASAKLPIFPVRSAGADTASTDHLKVEVRRDGAVVSVQSAPAPGATPVVAWLVDASGFDRAMDALELTIAPKADVVARVRVEASDDLKHWRRLNDDAPVVRTRFAGEQLEQLRVPLNGARARYLRLTDARGTFSFPLDGVRAIAPEGSGARELESLSLAPTGADPAGRAWEYDSGGRFPVERVALAVAEDNAVLPFELESRSDAKQSWRPIAQGVAYRFTQDGVTVASGAFPVSRLGDRYLRVRVTGSTPLPTTGPTLELRWLPAELVFAARGTPPFTLAYGLADAGSVAMSIETLVPGYGTPNAMTPKDAEPGDERTLAGDAATRAAPDFRRWGLWAVLVLGVLVLGSMGLKLARESGRGAS